MPSAYIERVIWIGALFVAAWAIGMITVPHAGWFIHLPLLIGGAAMAYAILWHRRASL